MSRQSLRSRLSEVYNKCIRSKGGIEDIEELSSVIEEAKNSGLKCSELAVCYAMRCDRLLDIGDFDKAHSDALCAKEICPKHVEVVHALINVHWSARDASGRNKHVDNRECLQYTAELENAGRDDPRVLEFCSRVYSSLSMFECALQALMGAKSLVENTQGMEEIHHAVNKSITEMHLTRYRSCPDEENNAVLAHLVELLRFEQNTLSPDERAQAVVEVFERVQFVLSDTASTIDWNLIQSSIELAVHGLGVSEELLEVARLTFVAQRDNQGAIVFLTDCLRIAPDQLRSEILFTRSRFHHMQGNQQESRTDMLASQSCEGELSRERVADIESQLPISKWPRALEESSITWETPKFSLELQRLMNRSGLFNEFKEYKSTEETTTFGNTPRCSADQTVEIVELKMRINKLEKQLKSQEAERQHLIGSTPETNASRTLIRQLENQLQKTSSQLKQSNELVEKLQHDVRVREEVIQELKPFHQIEAVGREDTIQSLQSRLNAMKKASSSLMAKHEHLIQQYEQSEQNLENGYQEQQDNAFIQDDTNYQQVNERKKSNCKCRILATLYFLLGAVTFLVLVLIILASATVEEL